MGGWFFTFHLTGLDILRRHYPQATLISGQGAADFFMHPKSAQAITLEDRHINKRLDALGWQSDRPPVDSPPLGADFDVMVDEAVLDLGGIAVQFIEIHGHSPSSLAVWVPEKELLAASDALGFRYLDGSFLPLFFTGYAQYMHTLERLESFGPKVVCLGHQGPLSGRVALEAFGSARRAALAMRNRIRNYSGSDAILADEIFTEIYRDELRLYSEQNIRNCVRLLIHRARTE